MTHEQMFTRVRRRIKMNKKVIACLISVVAAMIVVIVAGTQTIRTSAENNLSDMTKCYACVEIQPEDTLWSISKDYAERYGLSTDEYAKELMKVNDLHSDRIYAGAHIIVVYWE